MANRDVNLIIRAKNEASKTLGGVTDAIKLLKDAQDRLVTSASSADQSIGSLTGELDRLKTAEAAAESLKKVEAILGTMGATVTKLKGELTSTEQKLTQLGTDSASTAKKIADLEAESAKLVDRQKADKKAAEDAAKAIQKQAAAYQDLKKAKAALERANALPADAPTRPLAISTAQTSVAQNQGIFDSATAGSNAAKAALAETTRQLKAVSTQLKDLHTAQVGFALDTDKTKAAVQRQTDAVAKADKEFEAITQDFTKASMGLDAFGLVTDTTQAKTASLMSQIERLGAVMKGIGRYSTGGGSFTDPKSASQLTKLNADRDAAMATQQLLQVEAQKLAAQIKLATGDTSALVQRFNDVTGAAAQAKNEAAQLAAQMHKISGVGNVDTPMLDRENQLLKMKSDALKGVKKAADDAAPSIRKVGTASADAAGGMVKLNHESRSAMSVFQRMRGELLSLASAYIGLYGTINSVGTVITSYRTMEAAQNRLGVVFNQDQQKTGMELQWLAAQASRLGIEFGSLSEQYSKFAVSANAANFTTAQTRKIFIALAEAGRVNKLSLDDMNGVFLAATQMIQKSKVSAEELRQQMAERLPGAVNIFADALGVSTAELSKMMQAGQVMADSDTMIKFADELQKKFGPQLAHALAGTSKEIGDFQNNLFQASLQTANGGFIDRFNVMLAKMNSFFKSREGHDFFLSLGAAAGHMADAVSYVIDHINEFKIVLTAIVEVKLAQWVYGVVTSLQQKIAALAAARVEAAAFAAAQAAAGVQTVTFGARLAGVVGTIAAFTGSIYSASAGALGYGARMLATAGSVAAFGARVVMATAQTFTMGATMGGGVARSLIFAQSLNVVTGAFTGFSLSAIRARVSTIGASIAMGTARVGAMALAGGMAVARAGVSLLSATITALGGPLGILLTLASFFLVPLAADWMGSVDDVNRAADEHQRIMSAVLEQYDSVKGKADAWGASVKSVSLDQANANLREMAQRYDTLKTKAANAAAGTTANTFSNWGGFDGASAALTTSLRDAGLALKNNSLSIDDYIAKLNDLYKTVGDNQYMQAYIEDLLKSARAARDSGKDFSLAAEIADGFGSTIDLVARGLGIVPDRLTDIADAQDDANGATDKGKTANERYNDSLLALMSNVPEYAKMMKKFKDATELSTSAWGALVAAVQTGDLSKIGDVGRLFWAGLGSIFGAGGKASGLTSAQYEGQYAGMRGTPQGDQTAELVRLTTALAEQMGLSAKDLLSAMSFETGGTLDPNKMGGAGGAYRGLIQFSPDNQARYGIGDGTSLETQVSAVGDYLKRAGVLPGDGLPAIYAAILSGNAKNVNASDVANGGVVANVTDAVNGDQFAGHVARAEGLLAAYNGVATAAKTTADTEKKHTEELEKQRVETEKALSDMGFDNTLLNMRLAGGEKEAFIEEKIHALKEQNKNLTAEQERSARVMLGTQYDLNKALEVEKDGKKDIEAITAKIDNLESQRSALTERRDIFAASGDTGKVSEINGQITTLNFKLKEAIDNAIAMYKAIGGDAADAAIAKLETTKAGIENVNYGVQKTRFSMEEMQQAIFGMLENGIVNVFDSFAQAIAHGENAVKALGQAFQQMASEILIELGQMIIKQVLFNAISGVANAMTGGLGSLLGMGAPAASAVVLHSGGIAGSSSGDGYRSVSPAWFTNAQRYHNGGIAGLKPNELPAVLEVGEEIVTEDDPMHSRNRGKGKSGAGGRGAVRIINAFDVGSLLSEALKTVPGEEAILNHVRANPGAYKQAMEG